MSTSYIPEKIKIILWGKAAGRCQYDGCNQKLFVDPLTKAIFNQSYIAHIIADSPKGPRGHETLSAELSRSLDNLMLLCDRHHRLIDKEAVDDHDVERLTEMKSKHELKIHRVTNFKENMESHVVMYGANIGSHSSSLKLSDAINAISPEFYPSNENGYSLGLGNSSFQDHESAFWEFENENLTKQFSTQIEPIKKSSLVQHYSVFGLAPQPLLIKLGTLLHDLPGIDVYTLQKEPKTWRWEEGEGKSNYFTINRPVEIKQNVALIFSLSAKITTERITSVLGPDTSVWEVTISNPNNDFMKFSNHLVEYRNICRSLFNEIKTAHGEKSRINIFPAMLPSTAIELGRVWYPKADLPLVIFDQNKKVGGFMKTIEIN